jgi:hypothetical protein
VQPEVIATGVGAALIAAQPIPAPPVVAQPAAEPEKPTSGAPPWARPKQPATTQATLTPTPALVQSEQAVGALSLEDKVAQMVAPSPAKPRVKPINPLIKKVKLPEFADRVSPADAFSDAQYQRALAAMGKIPNVDVNVEGQLRSSVKDWIGLPITEVNSDTLEVLIGILENFTNKEALKIWAQSKGLWAGE